MYCHTEAWLFWSCFCWIYIHYLVSYWNSPHSLTAPGQSTLFFLKNNELGHLIMAEHWIVAVYMFVFSESTVSAGSEKEWFLLLLLAIFLYKLLVVVSPTSKQNCTSVSIEFSNKFLEPKTLQRDNKRTYVYIFVRGRCHFDFRMQKGNWKNEIQLLSVPFWLSYLRDLKVGLFLLSVDVLMSWLNSKILGKNLTSLQLPFLLLVWSN